jgi:hypothetical protein
MDIITVAILVLAVLALGSWGYGYAARPATMFVEPAPAPAPGLTLLGVIGLILLVAFFVLLASGWRFGLEVQPPR